MRRKFLLSVATALICMSAPAAAQTYPERPVTIINPFPGGPTDTFARLVANKLQAGLGQPVVVSGRPGAGGTIGVTAASKSEGDGYTLLVTSASTQVVQPVVRKSLPFDVEKDFIPIASTGQVASVLVAHPSLPVSSIEDLIAYTKKNPGSVSYGSSGSGTALHLAGEVFASLAGVELLHVPYKTAAQSMTDLLGGQVQMMFDSPNNSGPHIKSGKLKGLALMGNARTPILSDIPTTAELGFADMTFYNWLGVYAPAGTPDSVIARITEILRPGMKDADMQNFFELSGMPSQPLFGDEFAKAERDQRLALRAVVEQARIPLID